MYFRNILFSFFILVRLTTFSQEIKTISGKVKTENKALSDVIIELRSNKSSKFAVSDKNGDFKFSISNFNIADSTIVKVVYENFLPFSKRIENLNESLVIDINLVVSNGENLKEVVVENNRTINTVRKTSYKIDQKDFIKNTKANEVLKTVPNVYVNSENGVIVDGKLSAKLFVDGIELMDRELGTIDAASIDKIEVMNNPSSSYGTEFLGAVINIITKKKTEEFIKGSLGATAGAVNNYYAFNPSLSYKRGRVTLKSYYYYSENQQKIDFKSIRIDNNGTFFQDNRSNTLAHQPSLDTKLNIKLSAKSDITFTNSLAQVKFSADAKGYTVLNNANTNRFTKIGESKNQTISFGSVFNYKSKENRNFYLKAAYNNFLKNDESTLNFNNTTNEFYKIETKSKEFSANAVYEAEELTIFKKSGAYYSDVKYINRNFDFLDTNFSITQSIVNYSNEIDNKWSDKFSTEIAVTLENTRNYNKTINQNYNLFLPTFNALYQFKNKTNAKFGYSRKVLRPSAQDLNEDIIITYPGLAKQGNSNLDPQLRNYFSLSFSKAVKATNYSIKFYNESVNNSIEEVYKTQGDLLVQTLENAAKFNSLGMNFGLRTKLFKKIMMNLNSGFDYNVFESKNSVIQKNSGYTFRGNLNLNTKLFKDKVSVSFSGMQNGPEYSLLSKRNMFPYLALSLGTNLLKNRLNVQLYAQSILGKSATGFTDTSSFNKFYQRIDARNNNRNLLLILTYNFGKKFNDNIDDNNIENDDIRR